MADSERLTEDVELQNAMLIRDEERAHVVRHLRKWGYTMAADEIDVSNDD